MIGSFARWPALVAGILGLGLPLQAQVVLVPTGSLWRYSDQGSEPTGWKSPIYNDAAWTSGPAQLGFGDGDEATVIARMDGMGANIVSYYFRHTFTVPDPSQFTNLLVRLRRDDGAIVYLNGEEVFRSNLPQGPVNYGTFASGVTADDGVSLYAGPASISLLVPGDNVLAVEVHQASLTSSDVSFDLEFLANVQFQSPRVWMTKPGDGDFVGAPLVHLAATASDIDGSIAEVEFFDGATLLGTTMTMANGAFVLTWTNAAPGSHAVWAIAVDSTGLSATSAPVTMQVVPYLIPRGAAWNYLDDGTDLTAMAWTTLAYDDSSWSNGVAELGYGEGDEATLVNSGPAGNFFITTYFRHAFQVADPAAYSNLVLRVLRDDGVVVYLNGVEIYRNNLPAGAIDASTTAPSAIDDAFFHAAPVNPASLVSGTNLLAVELHQSGPSSTDISFDLELLPNVTPSPPHPTITGPTNGAVFLGPLTVNATVEVWDLNDAVLSVALYVGDTLVDTGGVNIEGKATLGGVLNPGTHTLHVVAIDAIGLNATSPPVTVQVIPEPILTTLVATGSSWRYFDGNANLGTTWRDPAYDDSSWSNGVGILGFGLLGANSLQPATLINGGPSGSRYTTAYFRRHFMAAGTAAITNLAFRVVRDDGVVAYLNGAEIFRMNMPTGSVVSSTRANVNVAGTNELFYAPTNVVVIPGLLLEGENVLAVELHQDMPTTSDGAFDLLLVAVGSPSPPPPTPVVAYVPPDVVLTWPGAGLVLQRALFPQGPYVDLPGASSPYVVPQTEAAGFFRLKKEP